MIGDIDFETNAFSRQGIDRIEFYLDDELIAVDDHFPYEWTWDDASFGKHKISIKAVDKVGEKTENEMIIWKFDT